MKRTKNRRSKIKTYNLSQLIIYHQLWIYYNIHYHTIGEEGGVFSLRSIVGTSFVFVHVFMCLFGKLSSNRMKLDRWRRGGGGGEGGRGGIIYTTKITFSFRWTVGNKVIFEFRIQKGITMSWLSRSTWHTKLLSMIIARAKGRRKRDNGMDRFDHGFTVDWFVQFCIPFPRWEFR